MARLVNPAHPRDDAVRTRQNITENSKIKTKIRTSAEPNTSTDKRATTENPKDDKPVVVSKESLEIRYLRSEITISETEIQAALNLVAESVIQQRHKSVKVLILHRCSWALMAAVFICAYYVFYDQPSDWPKIYMTCIVSLMAGLLLIHAWVRAYTVDAERFGTLDWLYGYDPSPNILAATRGDALGGLEERRDQMGHWNGQLLDGVIVVSFAQTILATAIFRIVPCLETYSTGTPSDNLGLQDMVECKAFIRAWTVKESHRGLGIGALVLRETARACILHGSKTLSFADIHAHSLRIPIEGSHANQDLEMDRLKIYLDRTMVQELGEQS